MGFREDYIYWKICYELMVNDRYRIIHLSPDYGEVWLENIVHKSYPLIRLKRFDIDWSNWLKRDIQGALTNANHIRKMFLRKKINVLNIYITSLPPVDSYEHIINQMHRFENTNTMLKPVMFDGSDLGGSARILEEHLGRDVLGFIKSDYDYDETEYLKNKVLREVERAEKNDRQLLNQAKPLFTYVFLGLQVFVFMLLEMSGGSTNPLVLLTFGAKYNPLILEGEWWRLITPVFLHIGFLHLFMNSLALYYLGIAVERIYGRLRFLFIYLFSGFFGALASFIFSPHLSAGASGAIFGLFGALLFFGTEHRQTFFRTMGMNIIILIVINIVFSLVVPSIDMAGHFGGLIGGFLAAGITRLPGNTRMNKQLIYLAVTILLTGIGLIYGFQHPTL